MIITRTPFRVSLFGGGSDYPAWYRDHGGKVLGFAIDKYCYISVRRLPPFFDHKHRIVYSLVENVNAIDEIKHPAVRAAMSELDVRDGLEIHHDGDLPARSGIGSSSSFTVGLVHALHALEGRLRSQRELADQATHIEQSVIGENVGAQDQIWAAFGGFNRIEFRTDGNFDVMPVIMPMERYRDLQAHFMLFFSGISRHASEIAGEQIANLKRRAGNIRAMMSMVDEGLRILGSPSRPLADLGELLNESWMLKRELASSVSNRMIDDIYDRARAAGAMGGKLLGAGGGGFMLLFVAPDRQEQVRKALDRLIEVRFGIDGSGSRVVVYEPSGLSQR